MLKLIYYVSVKTGIDFKEVWDMSSEDFRDLLNKVKAGEFD